MRMYLYRGARLIAAVVLLVAGAATDSAAQHPDAEVMQTIQQLFDGMRAGDSTAVRAAFDSKATLKTVVIREGETVLAETPVDRFVEAVGQPHEQVWDERTWGETVLVDDPLATAWTPYAFYLGDQFSHCGVNAFQLVRRADGWKITSIVDTRRQEGCNLPPEED